MDTNQLAAELSKIDAIETWPSHCAGINSSVKIEVFEKAEGLWVKRMLQDGKLLVHPDVAEELCSQNWTPNDLQKRMIWASILGTDDSGSKNRFDKIKDILIKKHGKDWWEDVYQRKTNVYAAKERIRKIHSGPAVSTFTTDTVLGASCEADERAAALKMIPKT
jgi:hypothetical protein